MAAVTVTSRSRDCLAEEFVILEASDGETYVSKLGVPYAAGLQVAATTTSWAGSAVNLDYALSGRTFTIRFKVANAAVSDGAIAMLIKGKP
jgi:hypothetical protein